MLHVLIHLLYSHRLGILFSYNSDFVFANSSIFCLHFDLLIKDVPGLFCNLDGVLTRLNKFRFGVPYGIRSLIDN